VKYGHATSRAGNWIANRPYYGLVQGFQMQATGRLGQQQPSETGFGRGFVAGAGAWRTALESGDGDGDIGFGTTAIVARAVDSAASSDVTCIRPTAFPSLTASSFITALCVPCWASAPISYSTSAP
jgi:hypothetical protein